MRISAIIAVLLVTAVCMAGPAMATERYYTFMGLTGGGGINQVSYSGWVNDSQRNLDLNGSYYSAGLVFCVTVQRMIGEFTMQYLSNSNSGDVDTSVSNLYLSMTAKYAYALSQMFHLTAGAGLYGDAPPATSGYEGGGGFLACAGIMINLIQDVKIMADAIARYGTFGMGEGSTKLSYGGAVSILYSVGRI